jgi:glycerate 2-kinase
MKVLVAPDSFKGSLTAAEAARAMARGVLDVWPDAEIRLFPMADGGEGTLDAVLAAVAGERRSAEVTDAIGNPLRAEYGVLPDGTAVIETARIIGLTLPGVTGVPVARRTTAGVGELLRHCLASGIRRFMIGLGGSATNDGGIGMLQALGLRVKERQGELAALDFTALEPRLARCDITLLADVTNPLCGPQGATAVFGPQKGVPASEIAKLDARLRRFGELGDAWCGRLVSLEPGSGAAGGMGYALQLLGGRQRSGAEVLLDLCGFDAALAGANLVLTGEGRSDLQTLYGKTPWVVAGHAAGAGVPALLVSGTIEHEARARMESRFMACHAVASAAVSTEMAMRDAARLLEERTAEAIAGCRLREQA